MQYFSSIKITLHCFHVDNNEEDTGIGYDMIIGCHLWYISDFGPVLSDRYFNGIVIQYQ